MVNLDEYIKYQTQATLSGLLEKSWDPGKYEPDAQLVWYNKAYSITNKVMQPDTLITLDTQSHISFTIRPKLLLFRLHRLYSHSYPSPIVLQAIPANLIKQ